MSVTTAGKITYAVENQVAWIIFDRPERRNALTADMYAELVAAAGEAENDDDVRAIVFAGSGDHFVAGADIDEFLGFENGEDGVRYEARQRANLAALEQLRKPTIAAVDGYAVGGGMSIASICDVRICTDTAQFGYPTARTIGNCLDVNGYALLMSMVGEARARTMMVTASFLPADEALMIGYVMEIVAADELRDRAQQLAEKVARNAPLSIYAAKESMRRIRQSRLPDTRDIVELVYGSDDFKEGVAAFSEKRKATWRL